MDCTIEVPRQFPRFHRFQHHPEQSLYGLIRLWKEQGLTEVVEGRSAFIWWGGVGNVLLYAWPTLMHLSPGVDYKLGLFGNPELPINGKENRSWIFWCRHTRVMEKWFRFSRDERQYGCAFMGSYENPDQRAYRNFNYWARAFTDRDLFSIGHIYSPDEYARILMRSRFGLCLRGFGPKCHREIECMAMGCVPIITPGVSLSYHEPPELGRHYLTAKSPEEVRTIVETVPDGEWREMSWQCKNWYQRNCSVRGSFEVTKQIVSSYESVECVQPG